MEETRVDLEMIKSSSVPIAGELKDVSKCENEHSHERRAEPRAEAILRPCSLVK